jgi:hypothetical protein
MRTLVLNLGNTSLFAGVFSDERALPRPRQIRNVAASVSEWKSIHSLTLVATGTVATGELPSDSRAVTGATFLSSPPPQSVAPNRPRSTHRLSHNT